VLTYILEEQGEREERDERERKRKRKREREGGRERGREREVRKRQTIGGGVHSTDLCSCAYRCMGAGLPSGRDNLQAWSKSIWMNSEF
jgi:hypothetical protein